MLPFLLRRVFLAELLEEAVSSRSRYFVDCAEVSAVSADWNEKVETAIEGVLSYEVEGE